MVTQHSDVSPRGGEWPLVGALIDGLVRIAASRVVFALTVVGAASLIWLSYRPPMADLPQHVAQVALWHDLLLGQSAWADMFRINLLTPYLTGYTLALMLSFVVSALTAVKLVLTAAFVAFVISGVQLSRAFDADKRLDWLMIPGFFGFAYEWGLFSFLVAAPIGLQFIRLAYRNALYPTLRRDVGLVVLGIILLFSHGLIFLFAGFVGGALVLCNSATPRSFLRSAWLYLVLAVACVIFFIASRNLEAPANLSTPEWGADGLAMRLPAALLFTQSAASRAYLAFTCALLMAPLMMAPTRPWRMAVPLLCLIAILVFAPMYAFETDLLYPRFAIFLLPLLALRFGGDAPTPATLASRIGAVVLMFACFGSLAVRADRTLAYAYENKDFETVLAAAEPGRRAASLVTDLSSAAIGHPELSGHQPVWYQVDKKGLVEFNFAFFHPQVVRYKTDRIPAKGFGFAPRGALFSWSEPQSRIYEYYFVRQTGPDLPPEFAKDPGCVVRLVKSSGPWSLFERGVCKS
jgi:hypothetical protein